LGQKILEKFWGTPLGGFKKPPPGGISPQKPKNPPKKIPKRGFSQKNPF